MKKSERRSSTYDEVLPWWMHAFDDDKLFV